MKRKSTKRQLHPLAQEVAHERTGVKGFFRLHIVEDGKVVGNTGWKQNVVVNNGFAMYLADLLGQGGSSKQISRAMLGSGTNPAVTDNTLNGEFNTATYTRTTVTYSQIGSKTAQFAMTWASSSSHILASTTLGNIGIINNTTSAGTLMAGQSFATSQWNTNQDVQATYQIRFS